MKKIAIYGKYLHEDSIETVLQILQALDQKPCAVFVEKDFYTLLQPHLTASATTFSELDAGFDFLISIGGDGTILRAVAFIGSLGIPIIGINTGRLGFLATVPKEDVLHAIDMLFTERYSLSKRSLITCTSDHAENHLPPHNFALNEVTVSRMNTTSMIQIETHLNGQLLTSYWADGLIISTPTGSTGYSMSCGGPVIAPQTSVFIITPIAPHNLNARPLVIPDSTVITIKVKGREDTFLASLDNRIASYPDETVLTLQKAAFAMNLVELHTINFVDTIRQKLLWGEDKRN